MHLCLWLLPWVPLHSPVGGQGAEAQPGQSGAGGHGQLEAMVRVASTRGWWRPWSAVASRTLPKVQMRGEGAAG